MLTMRVFFGKGKCTVPDLQEYDGKNHGINAGRCCWQEMKKVGTITGMEVIREKFLEKCLVCEFFKKVKEEEDSGFKFFINHSPFRGKTLSATKQYPCQGLI